MFQYKIKTQKNRRYSQGFTLIEFIMYMAIGTIILGSMSLVLLNMVYGGIKQQALSEVGYNAQYVLSAIEDVSRKAESTTYPLLGETASSVIFLDDTISVRFFVEDGRLCMARGLEDKIFLTTQKVTISDFEIVNISSSDSTQAISLSFRLEARSDSNFSEYQFSEDYNTTFTLRK